MPNAPRITGPAVHGVRPLAALRHRLTACGTGPFVWSADSLPRGVKLDSRSGILTGCLRSPGVHSFRVRANGPAGAAERLFTLSCGNRLALTPPMGWSSWNCWGDHVSAAHVHASAEAMESSGLAAHGWSYVNIDDAWQGVRAKSGDRALRANEKFPDMAGLVEKIHSLGLRAGIYSSPWSVTYAGYRGDSSDDPRGQAFTALPADGNWWNRRGRLFNGKGLHSFTAADARQFARWGFDYLKYDWFPIDGPATRACAEALRATGRDIVLSLSNSLALSTLPDVIGHAQLWRTTNDLRDAWSYETSSPLPFQGVRDVARWHEAFQPYQCPGAWNDADMLVLGKVGWGPELHPTKLTPDEQTTHFALWCLWSAPLLVGCPLDQLDAHTRSLLTNPDLIDINQDSAGVQAWRKTLGKNPDHALYYKPLSSGDVVIGLVNFSDSHASLEFDFRKHAERSEPNQFVHDCLLQKPLGELRGRHGTRLAPHACAVYRLTAPVRQA